MLDSAAVAWRIPLATAMSAEKTVWKKNFKWHLLIFVAGLRMDTTLKLPQRFVISYLKLNESKAISKSKE